MARISQGYYDQAVHLKALHSVSVWSSEHGLMLGRQTLDTKSNEITALSLLLKLLNVKDTIAILNVMGTQTAASQIKQAGVQHYPRHIGTNGVKAAFQLNSVVAHLLVAIAQIGGSGCKQNS
jgi:hypothetical protein